MPASEIERRIRAFDPFPGVSAQLGETPIKFWRACTEAGSGEPGSVLAAGADGIVVACGDGVLRILMLQKPGSRRMEAGEFLRGFPVNPGDRFQLG